MKRTLTTGEAIAPKLWCIGAMLGLWACAGCGGGEQKLPDRARVSGFVTYDGKPLPGGTILFKSVDKPLSTAVAITEGGTYSTDRAPIGKNVVTIDTASIQYGNPAAYVPIPEKYNDREASGLSVDVQAGENENVDFSLTK